MNEKKRRELHYLEEARRASPIFPTGDFVPDDPLDFVVSLGTGAGTLGIEVTELCQRERRAKAARLGNVTPKAQALYCARRNAEPVDVTALFSQRAHELYIDDLAGALADFVYEHRASDRGRFSTQLPDGFFQIGVCPALHVPGGGEWQYFREFEVRYALRPLIDSRITEKNNRVPAYRAKASQVWLVLVNDRMLGPGEVHVNPEWLSLWKFPSSFDKTLLFRRQADGSDDVIELRRH